LKAIVTILILVKKHQCDLPLCFILSEIGALNVSAFLKIFVKGAVIHLGF